MPMHSSMVYDAIIQWCSTSLVVVLCTFSHFAFSTNKITLQKKFIGKPALMSTLWKVPC